MGNSDAVARSGLATDCLCRRRAPFCRGARRRRPEAREERSNRGRLAGEGLISLHSLGQLPRKSATVARQRLIAMVYLLCNCTQTRLFDDRKLSDDHGGAPQTA
ncbi:MAG: hypothetical protein JNM13_05865 [Hyphomicrobiaceae bacterium]|nr:hypothetical protein [Hyphomicrobiaceae bacterium]